MEFFRPVSYNAFMPTAIHKIIRSRRRTMALQITDEGFLVVRAPVFVSDAKILSFIRQESAWIEKRIRRALERAKTAPAPLTAEEEKKLKDLARDAFIERACLYAGKMGVTFEKIKLSSAKTRWGSCSPKNNLNFNWRLIQAPTEILDYVVIHELAHLLERNHSPRFWAQVARYCPHYKTARRWLRENRL